MKKQTTSKSCLARCIFPAAVLVFFVTASLAYPQKKNSTRFNFNGEYGLWVEQDQSLMTVHWITSDEDSGFLKVFQSGTQLYDFSTPSGRSHQASFDAVQSPDLTLHYGSLTDLSDRHETVVYLNRKTEMSESVFSKIDSIYVLGDLHGEFDSLTALLKNAKVIDSDLNWIANQKHLVALGDIFDRGHDVTRTLWFLYKLERQARKQGGQIHVVLGNHEIMTFGNDLRYLSGKEKLIAKMHKTGYSEMFSPHHSLLGKWLAQKPGLIKIDKILFAHGGVTPAYATMAVNDSLNAFLQEDVFNYLLEDSLALTMVDSLQFFRRLVFFYGKDSVFWHRGYVLSDTLQKDLKKVLKKFKCKLHVVAHTALRTIREFYDGKLIAVDLRKPATEMLLLVRRGKNKYKRFRVKLDGAFEPL